MKQGGHWKDPPTRATYSSVVTWESVRIAFLIAAINGLEVIKPEKVHNTAGPEFGPTHEGQTVLIIQAMYGLKSSGTAWHAKLDFKPT